MTRYIDKDALVDINLDEAAEKYAILPIGINEGVVCIDKKLKKAFKAGALWMIKQLKYGKIH